MKYHAWDVVGHCLLLSEPVRDTKGLLKAEVLCLSCGCISCIMPSKLRERKSFRCSHCPPEYYFQIADGVAHGILPNGCQFCIDADEIGRVAQLRWHTDKDGYIVSESRTRRTIRLHNFIMGCAPDRNTHIDHINRDRTDCRRCNLRLVTAQQNCMNSSVNRSSFTGFRGVAREKSGRFKARIGLNERRIQLGTSANPVECAQMYNWAAPLIFGQFAGELNPVPEPPDWIKIQVEARCHPYLPEAKKATQCVECVYTSLQGV